MSYLPRMSKTYKEPEERIEEEPTNEITFNSIPIASAQPDEKAHNPQTVLKQYNYYPHPPPVLPGPSLIQEAEENEKLATETKRRRSKDESDVSISKSENIEELPRDMTIQKPTVNFAFVEFSPDKVKHDDPNPNNTKKTSKYNKTPKKGSLKVNKHKEEAVKTAKCLSNDPTPETESKSPNPHDSPVTNEIKPPAIIEKPIRHRPNHLKNIKSDHKILEEPLVTIREESVLPVIPMKGSVHEGVQCSPTSASEKVFVMPSCIHNLMRTLSFLVQELNRNESNENAGASKEVRRLISQISESINSLSNRKIDDAVALQTTLSDRKRLEKIYTELDQYIQDVYGENGKLGCKSEEKKRLYCKLSQKEYELNVLNEKLRESEIQNPSLKQVEPMTKAPEVVLQNKNLENEQLRAEVEFNSQELKKFHQNLAEKNWEIHKYKEEMLMLKKKLAVMKSKIKK